VSVRDYGNRLRSRWCGCTESRRKVQRIARRRAVEFNGDDGGLDIPHGPFSEFVRWQVDHTKTGAGQHVGVVMIRTGRFNQKDDG
jgi:hypothetical protein